jgi:peptidoglycan/LPS O-acetylase OafA/YrhL
VLAVVVYHALLVLGARRFMGGFLGVEVFFVLSGFLITTLLLEEWDRHGRINLGHFYLRRACRLFPALAIVVEVILLLSLADLQLPGAAAHAHLLWETCAGAILYVANWQIALQLPHSDMLSTTWTLAIEEQFYLAWPLTLLFLLRRGWSRERLLWLALAGFAAMSLWCFTLKVAGAPWARLKGTDTAAGGLLLGCAVAFLLARGNLPWCARRWLYVGRMGFVALVGLIVVAQPNLQVPPGFLPMLGRLVVGPIADLATAALLVGLLTTSDTLLHRTLRLAPLTWFGRISYGLYLWHWPLLTYAPHTPIGMVLWFGLSVGAAALSYYTVERTFRRIGRRFRSLAPIPALVSSPWCPPWWVKS